MLKCKRGKEIDLININLQMIESSMVDESYLGRQNTIDYSWEAKKHYYYCFILFKQRLLQITVITVSHEHMKIFEIKQEKRERKNSCFIFFHKSSSMDLR